MSLTPEPAGVAQGAFFLAGRLDASRGMAARTGSSWPPSRGDQRIVTPVLSDNVAEYEQARVEIETSPRPPGQARPGGRDEGGCVTPVPPDAVRDGGHYLVTSDKLRRGRARPPAPDEQVHPPRQRPGGSGRDRQSRRRSGSGIHRGDRPARRGRQERVRRRGRCRRRRQRRRCGRGLHRRQCGGAPRPQPQPWSVPESVVPTGRACTATCLGPFEPRRQRNTGVHVAGLECPAAVQTTTIPTQTAARHGAASRGSDPTTRLGARCPPTSGDPAR